MCSILHPILRALARRSRAAGLRTLVLMGVVQAFAVGLVLHLAHAGAHEAHAVQPTLHWLRDSALAVPASVAALAVATVLARRLIAWSGLRPQALVSRLLWALTGAAAYAAVSIPGNLVHGTLFGAEHGGMSFFSHAGRDAGTAAFSAFSVLLVLSALSGLSLRPLAGALGRLSALRPSTLPGLAATVVPVAIVGVLAGPSLLSSSVSQAVGGGACPTGAREVVYDLSAFQTVIPLNGWGDKLPDGLMYALKNPDARVGKREIEANPNLTQPLSLRANVGDCIKVKLKNDIQGRRVGLHSDGILKQDPKDSDGARVGNNPDTTVATGEDIVYTFYADRQGQGVVSDIANIDGADPDHPTIQRGLYGSVVVHPKGSTWHNPKTGDDLLADAGDGTRRALESQVFADVKDPGEGADFRSFAMVMLDENEGVVDRDGNTPTYPSTKLEDSTFGINYRSEPLRNRLRAVLDHRGEGPENPAPGDSDAKTIKLPNGKVIKPEDHFCDGYVPELGKVAEDPGAKCMSEESHLQSWPFGDEGKLIRRDAEGNPVRDQNGQIIVDSDNLIPKAYEGDPVKFHVVHPGAQETHPWHQHTQRWFADPQNKNGPNGENTSPRNDVQSLGPGDSRELTLERGAGGLQKTVGDSIFHCHLYPHFAQGFWGNLRIFDRLRGEKTVNPLIGAKRIEPIVDPESGKRQNLPDGTPLETLKELEDREGETPAPELDGPAADEKPGYPLFVKGDTEQRAYRPPNAIIKDDFAPLRRPGDAPRGPDAREKNNMPGLAEAKVSADGKTNQNDKPGAGFIDPCPDGAKQRTYRPHAIDTPIKYNSAGWKDREGRVYVEGEEGVQKARAGENPDPYTIRSKVGECVRVETTNDLHLDDDPSKPIDHLNKKDGDYMHEEETSEVSTHVHLVEFDELGSDGTSVGWNYSSSAMPGQTYGYRWFVDTALRTIFFHDHQYANLHQQKGLFAAMNVEPADAEWRDPRTGKPTNGVGPVADILSPSGKDFREFTVFHGDRAPMWKNDGQGDPVNPPKEVGDYGADQGGVSLNLRNEPFSIRTGPDKTGDKGDPANIFSSAVHGDPSTPLFKAYSQDPVVVRNVQGSHEEAHTFNLHGHRWLNEPDNPKSGINDNQSMTLAEYFNYEVDGTQVSKRNASAKETLSKATNTDANGTPAILSGGAGRPGDYLYSSTFLDDHWLGAWGLFRVPAGKTDDLAVLPDQAADGNSPDAIDPWPALKPGDPLTASKGAGVSPCPSGAPVRTYDTTALRTKLTYNEKTGDNDPNGLLYAPTSDVSAQRTGEASLKAGVKAKPLFIRANAGDCLKMTLRNGLPKGGLPEHTGDVPLPADSPFPKSSKVSMHPSLVKYDVLRNDGATVGYNYDQNVQPGQSKTYQWYVDPAIEGATTNLLDFGDRRGHRHHGLWGGLMIEPKGAKWTDPKTGESLEGTKNAKTGEIAGTKPAEAADIKWTDASGQAKGFREFVADFQDGLNLRSGSGDRIPEAGEVDDPYEQGNRGINYRTERFKPRLDKDPKQSNVLSSQVHGDPETPVFRAKVGDPVKFRVLQGQDRGRAHNFLLNGHEWPNQYSDPDSLRRSSQDGLLTGRAFSFDLVGGAGGVQGKSGDYLYRDGLLRNQVNAGLWGLLRAEPSDAEIPDLKSLR